MPYSRQDERFMQRALALARRGVGRTSPNPAVGAVLVSGGKIIGEGWHKRAGGAHAEIEALKGKGKAARGGTLYVTLEPCCTWGRTPPCTEAVIAAGIRRVVVAALDPNPRHSGRGLRLLRQAGIRVDAGLLAQEAGQLNAAFNKWITTGQPLVIAKAAMSLDGKIATRTGDSQWITSPAARRVAHRWRARVDAVMVAAGTVVRDNPRLTLRHGVRGRQPWRVVVDARGRSPRSARLFTDRARQRTIVVTTVRSSVRWRRALERRSVTVLIVKRAGEHVDLRAMLRELGKREITSVLVEGGGDLLGALFAQRLVDEAVFLYAPVVIGGRDAKTAVEGAGVGRVRAAWRFAGEWRTLPGGEVMFVGRRRAGGSDRHPASAGCPRKLRMNKPFQR